MSLRARTDGEFVSREAYTKCNKETLQEKTENYEHSTKIHVYLNKKKNPNKL